MTEEKHNIIQGVLSFLIFGTILLLGFTVLYDGKSELKEKSKYIEAIYIGDKNFYQCIKMIREVKSHYLSFNDKIGVPRSCEPYMYNTRDNLSEVNIGDTLEISFQSGYGVDKNYKGRTIKFLVNNFYEYNYS